MAMIMDFEHAGLSVEGGIIRIENPRVRGAVVVMDLQSYASQEQVDAGQPLGEAKRVSFSIDDFGGKEGLGYAKAYELVMSMDEYSSAVSDEQ